MLRVDVRELRRGPVETVGRVSARDPLFEGLDLDLAEPLRVSGVLEATGRGDYLWRGHLEGTTRGTCRRCLRELLMSVEADVDAVFTSDPELQDDPNVYSLEEPVARVDLSPAVREELALAVSAYPLCREDCAGLCPTCGADLNQGPCECSASPKPD
jgi:uncharacterized protein